MKKVKVTLAVLVMILITTFSEKVNAQITLEHIVDSTLYGYLFYPAKISDNETKYVFLDTVANTFSLYNLDFSPFLMNITVPHKLRDSTQGNGVFFYSVMYITRSLFDCDTSNIEYLFASQNAGNNPLWVMRTDGTILFKQDTVFGPYCLGCPGGTTLLRPILTTESGTKLVTIFSGGSSGGRTAYIYSLCGSLPTGSEEYDFTSQQTASYVKIFPNPANMLLTFEIIIPDNLNDYDLIILDNNLKEINRMKLRTSGTTFSIDVRNYSSGVYYYSLSSKSKIINTGKFILTK